MQGTPSDTPILVPSQLADACEVLSGRVHLAFPGRGLDRHARWLADHARQVADTGKHAVESRWRRRAFVGGGVAALTMLVGVSIGCVRRLGDIDTLPTFLSSLDAFFTVLAAVVAGGITMLSYTRLSEQKLALSGLNVLRSFAHVTDMLQLTKSPTRLLFQEPNRQPGAEPPPTLTEMSEYLAYCGELHSLTAKLAVLYGEWMSDPVVHTALDEVEGTCADLEGKTLQRLLLLEQMHQRVR